MIGLRFSFVVLRREQLLLSLEPPAVLINLIKDTLKNEENPFLISETHNIVEQ
jgi:hypothetical protein